MMIGGGRLTYLTSSESASLFVKGGIVEVGPDHVTVITDIALDDAEVASGNVPEGRNFDHVEYLTDDLSLRMSVEDNFKSAIEGV